MKNTAKIVLVILRILIGWHFAVEGISKLFNPNWTAEGYLTLSKGMFAPFFQGLAANPTLLAICDFTMMWGLTIVGIGLILGLFARYFAIGGALLLALFYLSYPPLIGADFGVNTDGSFLWINDKLIEMVACIVLAIYPCSQFLGLDRVIRYWKSVKKDPLSYSEQATDPHPAYDEDGSATMGRRDILKSLATTPVLGALVLGVMKRKQWESYEHNILKNIDGTSGATSKGFVNVQLAELKARIPHAKIGKGDFSRVMLGGNLIGGWAHARDLIYADKLIKAYNTDEKIFETFYLAEKCGYNTVMLNKINFEAYLKYKKRNIGNMQFLTQVDTPYAGAVELAKKSIDVGAAGGYMMQCGRYATNETIGYLHQMMEVYRSQGLPAGIGSHKLYEIRSLIEMGIKPDFVMKTFHSDNYWSARPGEREKDNRYCDDYDETVEFFEDHPEIPWIAFKILAAGAIKPEIAVPETFSKGADFICLGMYDFQVVENANMISEALDKGFPDRKRRWIT